MIKIKFLHDDLNDQTEFNSPKMDKSPGQDEALGDLIQTTSNTSDTVKSQIII